MWEFVKRVWRAAGTAVSIAERLWQIVVGLLGLTGAALMAWLSQTWDWYWQTFNWAGTAIAFLVSYLILSVGALLFSVSAALYSRRNAETLCILPKPDGPLQWFRSLTLEHPDRTRPFSLRVKGFNVGGEAVVLKEAALISTVSGHRIDMEVVAAVTEDRNEIVAINEINAVPPEAPIELVARFGTKEEPGLPVDDIIKIWSRFQFVAADNVRMYKIDFKEHDLAPFFPGRVGSRITKKRS